MEQLLHHESKENFLAYKTDKYDRVSDKSTQKNNQDSTKWHSMSDAWSASQNNTGTSNEILKSCS